MTIYIVLLAIIFFGYVCEHGLAGENRKGFNTTILRILFLAIYLVCILRASSVGRDLPGYAEIYDLTKSADWEDFRYIYFEPGYVFLMKICCAVGLGFQGFLVVLYAGILFPLYIFIKRYSVDYVFSVAFFVCYLFFEFDLSALRQAISMSICLLAIMTLNSAARLRLLYFAGLVFLGILFHMGAAICILIFICFLFRNIIIYTAAVIAGCGMSLLLRNFITSQIRTIFSKSTFNLDAGLYIGLNLIILILLAVFLLLVHLKTKRQAIVSIEQSNAHGDTLDSDELFLKIYMLCIMVALFFGEENAARSFMYLSQVICVLLPNVIKKAFPRISGGINFVLLLFLMLFFVYNSLIKNSLDIVPYQFYWEE